MRKRTLGFVGLMLGGLWILVANATPLPPGLAPAPEAARYAIEAHGEDYLAHNPRNGQRIAFRDGGVEVSALALGMPAGSNPVAKAAPPPAFKSDPAPAADWRLSLRLTGYGSPGTMQPVATAQRHVEGTRIEYRRGPITEWYENRPAGLEQGFTLQSPPSPWATDLVLVLAVNGDLQADWQTPGQALRFRTADGQEALSYSHLTVVDAAGNELRAHLALVEPKQVEIHVDAQGATWPIVVDPLIVSLQARLTKADGFGGPIAISGDTALIGGGRYDDDSSVWFGVVDVFTRVGSTWRQQAELTAAEGITAVDGFGRSVALSGNTAVIGAERDDSKGDDSGSAYVFVRTGSSWSQQAKLIAADGAAGALFGTTVAIEGDTILIGADADNPPDPSSSAGSVYVFTRAGSSWTQQAKLTASDGVAGDAFGDEVALSGDTALIVAAWADPAPAAYLFTRTNSVWAQQAKLTPPEPGCFACRGAALSGNTAMIADPWDSDDAGAVYAFTRTGSTWTQQAKLATADGATEQFFGDSVALFGDTALIGAPEASVAYLFTRTGSTWTQQAKLAPADCATPFTPPDENGFSGDYFGDSVALTADTALLTCPGKDAAYVYSLTGGAQPNPYARQVQQMYVAYYGRPGDPGGVDYWAGRLAAESGNWIADLVNAFGASAEYTERFGSLTNATLIDNLYQQLFNRVTEPLGRGFYIDLLSGTNASGLNPSRRQSTLAQIALDIANGAQNEDRAILGNKLDVATYFTDRVSATGTAYTAQDIARAVAILALVDASDDSVFVARTQVDDFVN